MKRIMNIADRHARALGLLLAAVLAALTAALNVSRGPLSNLNDIGGWTNRMAFIALAAAAHAAVLAMQALLNRKGFGRLALRQVLTTLGFLEQPHTSAGRIPSPAGYRFYIDRLMQDYRLSVDETQSINQAMESRMQELDKAMSQVGKLVSKLTNLPAYTMTAPAGEVTVRHFEIILADAGSFILVVMTSDENVKNRLIKLPLHVTEQDLKLLSAVLNASLTGLPASGFTPEVMNRVTRSAGAAASLVPVIVDFTTHVLEEAHRSEIYLTGQNRLLGQPEYQDLTKAQEVLGALDEDTLSNLPARLDPDSPVQILVGPENVAQELKDTSVVVTRFDIGDGMQGMIGVVGPQRMDYAQITARLSYFAEGLGRMFGKPELPAAPKPEVHEAKEEE